MMNSHRLESSFFSESKELTMYITGVEWLDKDMQRLRLDLKNVQADKGWLLTFIGKQYEEESSHQIWQSDYYDEQGQEYHFNSWSTSSGKWDEETDKYVESPGTFRVEIPLRDYPYDTVYMLPNFTRRVELPTPVVIKIK